MISSSVKIPGYTFFRKIGAGGFGTVYLAKKRGNASWVAVKIIGTQTAHRERFALGRYACVSEKQNLVSILDWGEIEGAIFYAMPLADALDPGTAFPPDDFRWQEASLQKIIDRRNAMPSMPWFSREEILSIIEPVFDAAIVLGQCGLLHRDIKPANILFFGGKTKLADFGLLEHDRLSLSNIGTPLYSAPSWFAGSHGNPDAYGLATTFYTLITGNLPDTVGRAAYRFPERWRGVEIPAAEREQWIYWHRCILRAIAENPTERFLTLDDFKAAIFSRDFGKSRSAKIDTGASVAADRSRIRTAIPHRREFFAGFVVVVGLAFFGALTVAKFRDGRHEKSFLQAESVSLAAGTTTRLEGGNVGKILVKGKGSRTLETSNGFQSGLIRISDGGELQLLGELSGKPTLEMVLSAGEKMIFLKNPEDSDETKYTLSSLRISGTRDAYLDPNIIVDKGVDVCVEGDLNYTFHADVYVEGKLSVKRIRGAYHIDFYGNGKVCTEAIACAPDSFTVQNGVSLEVGKGGIKNRCRTVFKGATIIVAESWTDPATGFYLEDEASSIFDLQAPDGTPTTAKIAGRIGGDGQLIKTGTGTLILSGENTYSGGTEVRVGTLVAGSASAFGVKTSRVHLAETGRIQLGSGEEKVALVAENFSIALSDFYRGNAAVFGNGSLSPNVRFSVSATGAYLDELNASQEDVTVFKIFDAEMVSASYPLTSECFTLSEELRKHWHIDSFSGGVLTLRRK